MAKLFKAACAIAFFLLAVTTCEATRSMEMQASAVSATTGGRELLQGRTSYVCFKPNYSVYNRLDCSQLIGKTACLSGDPTFDDRRICCQATFNTQPNEYWGCPFPKGTLPEGCYYIEWSSNPPSCLWTSDRTKCGAMFAYNSLNFCKDVLVSKGIKSP